MEFEKEKYYAKLLNTSIYFSSERKVGILGCTNARSAMTILEKAVSLPRPRIEVVLFCPTTEFMDQVFACLSAEQIEPNYDRLFLEFFNLQMAPLIYDVVHTLLDISLFDSLKTLKEIESYMDAVHQLLKENSVLLINSNQDKDSDFVKSMQKRFVLHRILDDKTYTTFVFYKKKISSAQDSESRSMVGYYASFVCDSNQFYKGLVGITCIGIVLTCYSPLRGALSDLFNNFF